jgi:hypothetical protein
MQTLLAVDLGLRTGLALYGEDGRLLWQRSRHLGDARALSRAARAVMLEAGDLAQVVAEGGGVLAKRWDRAAARLEVPCLTISAETWRRDFMYPRERADSRRSKETAERLARAVIRDLGETGPTALGHDAAEAVLVGLWGVLKLGWNVIPPPEIASRLSNRAGRMVRTKRGMEKA